MNRKVKILLSILSIIIGIILLCITINIAKNNMSIISVSSNTLIDIKSMPRLTINYIFFIVLSIILIVIPNIYLLLSKLCSIKININNLLIISLLLTIILSIGIIYFINNNILLHVI